MIELLKYSEEFRTICLVALSFSVGLTLQWLYQRIFGDLFREMDAIAKNIRLNHENKRKNMIYEWTKDYYKKRMIKEYGDRMTALAERLGRNK